MASPICKKEKGRKKKNLREKKKKKKKEVENIEIIEPPKKETTRQLVYHQILRSKYQQQLYAATPLFFVTIKLYLLYNYVTMESSSREEKIFIVHWNQSPTI